MIPFYAQEKDWTCAPACMRMALASIGIHKDEKELIRILRTNKKTGTRTRAFPELCEKLKLSYAVKRQATIADIKKLLKEKYVVIVCHYIPQEDEGHYAIVTKLNKHIQFHDPLFGKDHKLPVKEFLKNWRAQHEDERAWLFALRS